MCKLKEQQVNKIASVDYFEGSTIKGVSLVKGLLEKMVRAEVNCVITGRQKTGKTTLLTNLIKFIPNRYNLFVGDLEDMGNRVRCAYPYRNILTAGSESFKEIGKEEPRAGAFELFDDSEVVKMIKMGYNRPVLCEHHAHTTTDLIRSLRNALVNKGGKTFSDMETTEKLVTALININIHLSYTKDNVYYIDRITEIIPNNEASDFFNENTIIKYNESTNCYELVNSLSYSLVLRLLKNEMGMEFTN